MPAFGQAEGERPAEPAAGPGDDRDGRRVVLKQVASQEGNLVGDRVEDWLDVDVEVAARVGAPPGEAGAAGGAADGAGRGHGVLVGQLQQERSDDAIGARPWPVPTGRTLAASVRERMLSPSDLPTSTPSTACWWMR